MNMNKKKVIFPEPVSNIEIRPLQKTEKDYKEIARCFNSFNDSDSWPDGFGGSFVFTKEWAENEYSLKDLSSQFVALTKDEDQKIVGVCYCNRSSHLKDAWYVALLGVDPAFQGKKIGKSLLLKATNFALEKQARLISLHTWGGNLKAMPLYKRQGYKWRPDTVVYMENYIPQILNFPLFKPIFKQISWYDSFKPHISQEQDKEFIEKMKIYEYKFKNEKEDFELTTWIDRTIGYISGFHLKHEKEEISIKAYTPKSEAFIGVEKFPVFLEVSNNTNEEKTLDLSIISSSSIILNETKIDEQIKLKPNTKIKLSFEGSFLSSTPEFDDKKFKQSLVEHYVSFKILYNENEFNLYVGKIPKSPVKVEIFPYYLNVLPGSKTSIPFSISNFTGEKQNWTLKIKNGKYVSFLSNTIETEISIYDNLVEINAEVEKTYTTVDYIQAKIYSSELNKEIGSFDLPLLIVDKDKAIHYKINQFHYIENKYIRVKFDESPLSSNMIYIDDKKRKLKIIGNSIVLGLPFDNEGSEFYTKKLDHEIKELEHGLLLISTGLSENKKGIKVVRKLFIPHDASPLKINYELENTTDSKIENMGVHYGYWWWSEHQIQKYKIIPLKEGIYYSNLFELSLELGKDPSKLKEGWVACKYDNGFAGFLFNLEKTDKVYLDSTFPHVDYILPFIEPKTKIELPAVYFFFADDWKSIREKWSELYLSKYLVDEEDELPSPMRIYGISLGKETSIVDGLFIDKNSSKFYFNFDAFLPTAFKGEILFKEGKIYPNSIKLEGKKIARFSKSLKIDVPDSLETLKEKLMLDTGSYIDKKDISLCFYSKDKPIKKEIKEEKNKYIQVSNGLLTFRASHNFNGVAYFLSYKDQKNIFKTFWPESPPFLWDNRFFGGIAPHITQYNSWDFQDYLDLKFELLPDVRKGRLEGVGMKSEILTYSPYLKGLQVTNFYLTLPDSPFLLVQQQIYNHSGVSRYFNPVINISLEPSGTTGDKYYIDNGETYLTFRTQDFESEAWKRKKRETRWVAYKNRDAPYYLGVVINSRRFGYYVEPYIPNLTLSNIIAQSPIAKIKPKGKLTFETMIVFTDELEKIKPFTNSNIRELMED
ncbi:MAG: GNAT family N-acetyltransferase [Candidatus Heimdallarchaeaceae archaeon]